MRPAACHAPWNELQEVQALLPSVCRAVLLFAAYTMASSRTLSEASRSVKSVDGVLVDVARAFVLPAHWSAHQHQFNSWF